MILGDYHTHTHYCDGKASPEEMLLAAIDKGLEFYGFSSHSHLPYDEDWNMSHEAQKQYIAEVNSLKKKYASKISVLLGTECDMYSDNTLNEFDYVIGSCHCLIKDGQYLSVDHSADTYLSIVNSVYSGDHYAFVQDYFETMSTAATRGEFTFYGHFDLINKFNQNSVFFDETDPRYTEPMLCALQKLAKSGKPLELNTKHTFVHSAQEPSQSAHIWLSALYEMGGNIIINSDAHAPSRIAYNFEEATRLAKSCGFTRALALTPSGIDEFRLR